MRKRRKTAEILLARTPARSPRKSQAVPVTVETPKIWPVGLTSAQALEWWAEIRRNAKQAAKRRCSPHSRPVPVNLGTGRTSFVHLRRTVTTRHADETRPGTTRFPRFVSSHPEAQPMKIPTMIILGQIQQVTEQTMTDKRDTTKVSKMFLVVFADKTRPAQFRTATPFCTFLTEEKFRAQFGAVAEEAIDQPVTMAVHEIAPYNAFMKVKGQLVKGHQTGEQLLKMQADAAEASKPAAAPAVPAKKAA